jgi:hypothetical protein
MDPAQSPGTAMKDDSPNIRAVRPGHDHRLIVTWKGGAESIVDIGRHLADYAIFAPLRGDEARFRAVEVGEWGWSVHWSDDLEISSDTLWRLALQQGGEWLRAWRAGHRMSEVEAAKALGVSPRMWRAWEAGSHLLPKTVRLAAVGLDAEAPAA